MPNQLQTEICGREAVVSEQLNSGLPDSRDPVVLSLRAEFVNENGGLSGKRLEYGRSKSVDDHRAAARYRIFK
jgi:hypothetical protein